LQKKNKIVLTIQIFALKSGDSNCISQICMLYDTPHPLGTKLVRHKIGTA
jgi:hypothetical protein